MVQDALGNTVTTATDNVTLAIATNPANGTLSGTVAVAAVNGIATFNNLSIDLQGLGYTIDASAPGLVTATSDPFDIVSSSGLPVLGNSVEFATSSSHAANFLLGSALLVTTSTTLTHLAVIGKVAGPSFKLALYSDTNGNPDALIASTPALTLAVGVQEIAVTSAALPAGIYWIMGIFASSASIGINLQDPEPVVKYISLSFSNPIPTTFPAPIVYSGQEFNYYIKVTDPQGGTIPAGAASPDQGAGDLEPQASPPRRSRQDGM